MRDNTGNATCTVGEALITLLTDYGVEHVFGIPGVHTVELYRGLANSRIEHHTPRHEQGAGFMADGYARVSGKPGVCFVITGPGFTNIATAMAQALADSIPMLVISSVNDTLNTPHACGMLHEMPNQLAFSAEVTRFSHTIKTADELPRALARAFSVYRNSRPGPVHLQLPVSLLGTPTDLLKRYTRVMQRQLQAPSTTTAGSADLSAAAALLNAAQTPLILAGGGANIASDTMGTLAETLDAPVLMTINARGLLADDNVYALPATGSLQSVRTLIEESDVVLALGTELAATDNDMYKNGGFNIPGKLIRCDIDPMQLTNNFLADITLCGDAAVIVNTLLRELAIKGSRRGVLRTAKTLENARNELTTDMRRHLQLLERIQQSMPEAIFVGDSTQLVYSGNMLFNTATRNQWFNSSVGFGTLGYALPAAIGASLAEKNKPVICLIGDGGLQFVLGELGALQDSESAVAIIVWRNGGYREIKTSMENAGVGADGVELTVPDFSAIAGAYGVRGETATSDTELCDILLSSYSKGEPVLIEIEEDQFMQSEKTINQKPH
ncbi:hypothetical protein AB833_16210 [Chromatiales bacterium (ex Bugula neritina AB1)]|nr:hypothetical protein AB833_16210 [Chromatiales bacterium (ex Bugula neritina AB1)]